MFRVDATADWLAAVVALASAGAAWASVIAAGKTKKPG